MFRFPALGFSWSRSSPRRLPRPVSVTAADGRTVTVADASRIVSVGGTVTEILYALGVGDRIVGVDLTSNYPPRRQRKPKVGYMRPLAAEGVLALGPTVMIAIEDAGPPETVAVLAQASVPFLLVPKPMTPPASPPRSG